MSDDHADRYYICYASLRLCEEMGAADADLSSGSSPWKSSSEVKKILKLGTISYFVHTITLYSSIARENQSSKNYNGDIHITANARAIL